MQFKHVGNKVQVISYLGYDKEKKRAIVKRIGSLDRVTLDPEPGMLERMTEGQRKELAEWTSSKRSLEEKAGIKALTKSLPDGIGLIIGYIKDVKVEVDAEWSNQVYKKMEELRLVLKKHGFKKPKKEKIHVAIPGEQPLPFHSAS